MRRFNISPSSRIIARRYATSSYWPPIVTIKDATFYRQHPASHNEETNPPLFPGLNFELPSLSRKPEHWAIIGPSLSGKTTLLEILRGQHLSFPPQARSYPYLSSELQNPELRIPSRAIQYVGFGGEQGLSGAQGTRGAYLSARYESLKEATDWTVLNYLEGHTELNPSEEDRLKHVDPAELGKVVEDLRLSDLLDTPVANLSNGQTRRAKIAKAILGQPEVLLLDEPFMGLDPPSLMKLSPLLHRLADAASPRLILSLRPQDPIPDWITHLVSLQGRFEILLAGDKDEVLQRLHGGVQESVRRHYTTSPSIFLGATLTSTGIIEPKKAASEASQRDDDLLPVETAAGEPLIEMEGVKVAYGPKVVLGNWKQKVDGKQEEGLHWTVRRGQRWGILGANGSGKTTLLSLICSDHPQTYSQPVKLFGRSRLPEKGKPGISIFDIQSRIGHSSPEIHNHIPRHLTLRQVIENAWAETFLSPARLSEEDHAAVDVCLRRFEFQLRPRADLVKADMIRKASKSHTDFRVTSWASNVLFGELSFSAQRVALFLRAIVKKPDLVILDEAFSGMDARMRDKCMMFLAHGQTKHRIVDKETGSRRIAYSRAWAEGNIVVSGLEPRQALLCISHVREEIPGCVREWICLPEANTEEPARFGKLDGPLGGDSRRWNEIWGM